jgi:hypothetical protein
VFNLIREVLQSAERNAFLWRIDDISVTNGGMGDNDLRVALGSECSAFEKWFFEPNALTINILPCFDVIHCIDNKAQSRPEVIIENLFIFGAYSQLHGFEVHRAIDAFTN